MDYESTFIKPLLTFYFGKGYTELEAHNDITKQYGQLTITYKTIRKWYKVFNSRNHRLAKSKSTNSKQKINDENLIELVKDNSGASVEELAIITGYSTSNMYCRLSKIKNSIKGIDDNLNLAISNNSKKSVLFSDNYFIQLIKDNPEADIRKLSNLLNCSKSTISNRLSKINRKRDSNNKLVLKRSFSNLQTKQKFISDEFIINLIIDNPGLNMTKLSKVGNISISTISKRLRKININRGEDNKLILKKELINNTLIKKPSKKFTNEYLIDKITENPELNMLQLSKLLNCSRSTIWKRIKEINEGGNGIIYQSKVGQNNCINKLTDDYLINLVKENSGLNIRELSKIANCSQSALSTRLKQLNSSNKLIDFNLPGKPKLFTDSQLINLINNNPNLNMNELSKLIGVSPKTISSRIKKINSSGEKVNYNKKSFKKGRKFNDEDLIKLIKDNEGINNTELAKLVGCSQSTISLRLKEINASRPVDNKVNLEVGKSGPQKLFTDDYLIELITKNPTLNTLELSKLAKCSKSTLINRLRQINKSRKIENELKLQKKKSKASGKPKLFSDEYLINLIEENPGLNMKELAKICKVSPKTISRRTIQINSNINNNNSEDDGGKRVSYITKGYRKNPKFTNEYLIGLVNNNPNFNMKELAKVLNCSIATVSNRLRQINKDGERVNYCNKG